MKKISFLLLALALVITLSACTKTSNTSNPSGTKDAPKNEAPTTTNTPATPETTSTPIVSTGITLGEIAKHANASDCWMAIDGRVFDVTPYIKLGIHPGGEKILNGCGIDASTLFASIDKHDNGKARPMLEKYVIGDLAK
ncbi:MAG: cytochrome b5-like heme/steroid binding domain-containing protein [Patescibacteria group bacterium]